MFPDGCFDTTVCFGGALSYVLEKREEAAKELKRVTRSGGTILVSVMSRLGTMLNIARQPHIPILKQPDESTPSGPGLWQVFGNGDLTGVPSRKTGMMHAPMHLYTTDELKHLFADCQVLEIASSNVVAPEFSPALDEIAKDLQAWSTLVELERKLNSSPGLVDSGTHIIMSVRR